MNNSLSAMTSSSSSLKYILSDNTEQNGPTTYTSCMKTGASISDSTDETNNKNSKLTVSSSDLISTNTDLIELDKLPIADLNNNNNLTITTLNHIEQNKQMDKVPLHSNQDEEKRLLEKAGRKGALDLPLKVLILTVHTASTTTTTFSSPLTLRPSYTATPTKISPLIDENEQNLKQQRSVSDPNKPPLDSSTIKQRRRTHGSPLSLDNLIPIRPKEITLRVPYREIDETLDKTLIKPHNSIAIIKENSSYPIDDCTYDDDPITPQYSPKRKQEISHSQIPYQRRYTEISRGNDYGEDYDDEELQQQQSNTTRIKLSLPNDIRDLTSHRHFFYPNQHSYSHHSHPRTRSRKPRPPSASGEFTLPTYPPITVTIEPNSETTSLCRDSLSAGGSLPHVCDENCAMLGEDAGCPYQLSTGLDSLKGAAGGSYSGYLTKYFMDLLKPSDNKLAMKLFGSKKGVLKERLRQQRAGHCIIHPCSNFRHAPVQIDRAILLCKMNRSAARDDS
ncbi:unnamed protein product [Didymodactylos carnosus]|uniref:Ion transport N-terminal domain-containing protein n=1 Tax=Didymodactylos carnosus TaxID=1234261 RepID=A0A815FIY8_9BILA|nr:unnamed protein product [Didymodactylos carnosus]CAF1324143.1 unnamed protein product [Didymodactylos carnosus]CAF3973696.1 unnamed protein product [Didymodactylos carnosus]CAF4172503.1 unnamed protein product [Didymodactylos carnosus]